mgnify:CR=1 FL=1
MGEKKIKTNKTKEVIILGLGRTGTSMVAGILEKLGIDMGTNYKKKNDSNPLGYFENVEFLEINKQILKKAGGSHDNPPEFGNFLIKNTFFVDGLHKG